MAENNNIFKFEPFALKTVFRDPDELVPEPRSGHSSVSIGQNIYIFGGYDNHLSDKYYPELWCLNATSLKWMKISLEIDGSFTEFLSNVLFYDNDRIYVYGGTSTPFGLSLNHQVLVIIVEGDKAEAYSYPAEYDFGSYGSSITDPDEPYAYIYGGTTGYDFFSKMYSVSKQNCLPSMLRTSLPEPVGRYKNTSVHYKNNIVIIGGGNPNPVDDMHSLPVYSVDRWITWETVPDPETGKFPTPRHSHAGIMIPKENGRSSEYLLFGGFDGLNGLDDMWTIDFESKQWKLLKTKLPHRLSFHTAELTDIGKLIVFGGVVQNEEAPFEKRRTNEILTCWLKIPSLQMIAWEAVQHYIPCVKDFTLSQLLRLGLQMTFIKSNIDVL